MSLRIPHPTPPCPPPPLVSKVRHHHYILYSIYIYKVKSSLRGWLGVWTFFSSLQPLLGHFSFKTMSNVCLHVTRDDITRFLQVSHYGTLGRPWTLCTTFAAIPQRDQRYRMSIWKSSILSKRYRFVDNTFSLIPQYQFLLFKIRVVALHHVRKNFTSRIPCEINMD